MVHEMITTSKLLIFKALADKSRLAIINHLLNKQSYVDEIARGLNLSPSTVSFHLKKLEEAGLVEKQKEQYYTNFFLKDEVFNSQLRELVFISNPASVTDMSKESVFVKKIIHTFTKDGRIIRLPAQYKKRLVMLDYVSRKFREGEILKEAEVDSRISEFYSDYCTIRRMFIDEGYMKRENNIYTVTKTGKIDEVAEPKVREISSHQPDGKRKKELKREYVEKPPEAGAFILKNKVNNKKYIGTSVNLPGIINRYTFLLTLGKHENKVLQDDWNEYGKDAFEFTVLEKIKTEKGDNRFSLKSELEKLEEKWHTLLISDREMFYNLKVKILKKEEKSNDRD